MKRIFSTTGQIVLIAGILLVIFYFLFRAIHGEYGILKRVKIDAQADTLRTELMILQKEVAKLQNKNKRLSDNYLDLNLLDEQARSVLGFIRSDEVIIQ